MSSEDHLMDRRQNGKHGTVELLTGELTLRRYRYEDAEALYEGFGKDPVMYEFSGWNPYASLEMAQETVGRFIDSYEDPGFYGWAIQHAGALVGTIGAYDYEDSSIEVGLSIRRDFWGRGYATRALKKVLDYLTNSEGISRVTAWCASDNIGSLKAMEKAGMTLVKTEKGGLTVGDQVYDKLTYEYRRKGSAEIGEDPKGYTKENAIQDLKQQITSLSAHVSAYARHGREEDIDDFNLWTLWTFMVVERAVTVSLMDKGVTLDERGFPYSPEDDSRKLMVPPVSYAIRYCTSEYPRQCLNLLNEMRMMRNIAAHVGNIDKETLATFITWFKSIINWFLLETNELYQEYESAGVVAAFHALDRDISYAFLFENQKILLDNASLMNEKLDRLLNGQEEIKEKLDTIQERIEALNDRIGGYQSLVEKQIEMASSEEEEEHILHAFTQECVDRIISNVGGQFNQREYDTELNKLKLTFGDGAWGKMEESSKTFLVSSKMMFNQFVGMEDIVDYSGVCLLVTKALEVEMSKRFCTRYVQYLKVKYPGKANRAKFPYSMLNRFGVPLPAKHFTLGSMVFVMGISTPEDVTEEQIEHNKEELEEYARAELFAGSPEIDVLGTLQYYATRVDEIRERFRNPAAHTNEVRRVNAVECFETVVDVEKLLRVMLDSFDK